MSHKITLLEEITGSGNLVSVRQNIFNLLYFFFFPPLASTCTTPADSVAQIPPRSLPPSERRPACSCCSPRRRLLPVSCRVNFEQYIHAINTSKGVCAKKVVFHKFHLRTVHMPVGLSAHPSVAGVGGAECRAWPPMQSAHSLLGPAPSFLVARGHGALVSSLEEGGANQPRIGRRPPAPVSPSVCPRLALFQD